MLYSNVIGNRGNQQGLDYQSAETADKSNGV